MYKNVIMLLNLISLIFFKTYFLQTYSILISERSYFSYYHIKYIGYNSGGYLGRNKCVIFFRALFIILLKKYQMRLKYFSFYNLQ